MDQAGCFFCFCLFLASGCFFLVQQLFNFLVFFFIGANPHKKHYFFIFQTFLLGFGMIQNFSDVINLPMNAPNVCPHNGHAVQHCAGFAATMKAPVLPKVYEINEGKVLVVARLKGHTAAGEIPEDQRELLRNNYVEQKRQLIYLAWLEGLRANLEAEGSIELLPAYQNVLNQRTKDWNDQYKKGGKRPALPGSLGGR